MSEKSKRKKKRQAPSRSLPWTWLAAGGAVVLAVLLLLWQPWSGDDDKVEPLTDYPASAAPRLVVEQRTVDEGYLKYDVRVSSAFVLRNEGDVPLKILNQPQVELVRGC